MGIDQVGDFSLVSEPESLSQYPTPNVIRNGDPERFLEDTISALAAHETPSLDVAEALLSRTVAQYYHHYVKNEESQGLVASIPWPESAHGETVENSEIKHGAFISGEDSFWLVRPGTSSIYPEGLERSAERSLPMVTFDVLEQLTPEHQVEITDYLLNLIGTVPPEDMRKGFVRETTQFLLNASNSDELFSAVLNNLYVSRDMLREYEGPNDITRSSLEALVEEIDRRCPDRLIRAIAAVPDETQRQEMLKMVVGFMSFADTITAARSALNDEKCPTVLKPQIEKIGKTLMGLNPDDPAQPFFKAAYELYKRFPLDNYRYMEKELPIDLEVVQDVLSRIDREGTIVELGSGTGRVTNALAEIRSERIIGVEILPEYVRIAQERDKTGKVVYTSASWSNTSLEDNSAKLVVSLGRSLMAADWDELKEIAKEVRRLGGRMVFSYGDPDSPKYLQDKKYSIDLLKKLGLSETDSLSEEQILRRSSDIVSSSDGVNWVNRHIYTQDDLASIFSGAGLRLSVLRREPISGLEGAYSYYYFVEPREASPVG